MYSHVAAHTATPKCGGRFIAEGTLQQKISEKSTGYPNVMCGAYHIKRPGAFFIVWGGPHFTSVSQSSNLMAGMPSKLPRKEPSLYKTILG